MLNENLCNCIDSRAVRFASENRGPEIDETNPLDSKDDSGYAIYWIVNIFAVAIVALSAAGIFYARCIAGRP